MNPVFEAMEASMTALNMETTSCHHHHLTMKLTNSSSVTDEQLSNTSISESSSATSSNGAGAFFLEEFNINNDNNGGCLIKSKPEGSTKRNSETKKVSFASIDFHCHEVSLGDNAAVSSGPPLTISWKAVEHFHLSLDDYEKHRALPRQKYEMLLPRMEREERLRALGYSRGEMKEASQEAAAIRLQRIKSSRDGLLKRRIARWVKPSSSSSSSSSTK